MGEVWGTLASGLAKKGAGGDQGASRARESQRSGLRVFISCQGGGSHCSLAAGDGWIHFCLRRTALAEQWRRSMRSGARAVGRFDEGNWNRNRGVRKSGRANRVADNEVWRRRGCKGLVLWK